MSAIGPKLLNHMRFLWTSLQQSHHCCRDRNRIVLSQPEDWVEQRDYFFDPFGRCCLIISIMRSAVVPEGKKPMYFPFSSTR